MRPLQSARHGLLMAGGDRGLTDLLTQVAERKAALRCPAVPMSTTGAF